MGKQFNVLACDCGSFWLWSSCQLQSERGSLGAWFDQASFVTHLRDLLSLLLGWGASCGVLSKCLVGRQR